jgi:hypothetical protein
MSGRRGGARKVKVNGTYLEESGDRRSGFELRTLAHFFQICAVQLRIDEKRVEKARIPTD